MANRPGSGQQPIGLSDAVHSDRGKNAGGAKPLEEEKTLPTGTAPITISIGRTVSYREAMKEDPRLLEGETAMMRYSPQTGVGEISASVSEDSLGRISFLERAPGTLLLLIRAVLDGHNVRSKQLAQNTMAQAPSQRLIPGSYVFPGSKSEYNHALFLQENQQRPIILAIAYSKNAIYVGIDPPGKDKLLMKVLELNAVDPVGFWKLEERPGSVFPVLEMTLYSSQSDDFVKEYIWKTCGTLDAVFKAKLSNLSPALVADQAEVERKVKEFLEASGFRKIKESAIPNGHSFLVVMSSDDEPEETRWKRFPLKIDVTGILAFRIYFSLDDAAVTAKGHFSNSAKSLIAKLNPMFEVGYFNYASNSNQIQYTLKLHYKTLSPADLATSLKSYYDTVILCYKWTAPSLAALHSNTQSLKESLSEVSEYVPLVSDELQTEFQWRVVENLPVEKRDLFIRTLQTMSQRLTSYFLPAPVYRLGSKGLSVKTSRNLVPLEDAFTTSPLMKDSLIARLMQLFKVCAEINIYPTLNMVFYNAQFELRIVPDAALHENKHALMCEITDFILKHMSVAFRSNSPTVVTSPLLDFGYFDTFQPTGNDGVSLAKCAMGDEKCLLYRIAGSPTSDEFTLHYMLYSSELGTLPFYPNPLHGITLGPEQVFESVSSNASVYYLCEKYTYVLWKGDSPIPSLLQVAKVLQELHDKKFCHWFVNPFTIRQDLGKSARPKEVRVFPVLPCITPALSPFVVSFIPQKYHSFLAPEALGFIHENVPVVDSAAADVYSFSKVVLPTFKNHPRLSELQALLERGTSSDWRMRPNLSEIVARLQATQETL